MSAPVQNGIFVGGYYPSLRLYDNGLRHTSILFHDNYVERFKPLGIRRYEMMRVMPYCMRSDILFGLDDYDYYEEEKITETKLSINKIPDVKNDKYSITTVVPNTSAMNEKQKKRVDINGLSRWRFRINNKKLDIKYDEDTLCDYLNEIVMHQNQMPMRRLEPNQKLCSYISQKSRIQEKDQDIRSASVIIEPLNEDIFNMIIPHIPINQYLPINSNVMIKAYVPFMGAESKRKYIWSSNLQATEDSIAQIKKENPQSICTEPFLSKCHIGSIDLGSEITGKFVVADVDTTLHKSYQLFSFERDADDGYFELSMYYAYNISPKDLISRLEKRLPKNEYVKTLSKLLW